jgi:hypothetical protein
MAAFVHEVFFRHDMAAVAGLRELVDRVRPDHSLGFGELPARLLLGLGLGLLFLAAEPAMDLDPILAGAVTGFAGDARDRLVLVVLLLHREMAIQAQALRLDATHAHFFRDFICRFIARHLAEGFEVMRALPRLDLLLVAFGTGIRTDDLGRIERNCAVRGSAEDHQHAAEKKHG